MNKQYVDTTDMGYGTRTGVWRVALIAPDNSVVTARYLGYDGSEGIFDSAVGWLMEWLKGEVVLFQQKSFS